MSDAGPRDLVRKRCLDALRRNALLSGVLEEGYLPSRDPGLRARTREAMVRAGRRRRVHRSFIGAASTAALIVALTLFSRAPVPEQPVAPPKAAILRPPKMLLIVTTAAATPVFETVPSPAGSAFEEVRTAQLVGPLERALDEDLLASRGVVALVGHPGGVRRLILVSPAIHRTLE